MYGARNFARLGAPFLVSWCLMTLVWFLEMWWLRDWDYCRDYGEKSMVSFWYGFWPNLVLIQFPTAVAPEISYLLVYDRVFERLRGIVPDRTISIEFRRIPVLITLILVRVLVQVPLKTYLPVKLAGGMIVLENMLCTLVVPLFFGLGHGDQWAHHWKSSFPVVAIYLLMAVLSFVVLPPTISFVPGTGLFYLSHFTITAVELVFLVIVTKLMHMSRVWDLRNMSVWARVLSAMFLGFRVASLANPRAEVWQAVYGAIVYMGCELFIRHVFMDLWYGRSQSDGDAQGSFFTVYLATKKTTLFGPLVVLLAIKASQSAVFPELVNCASGKLIFLLSEGGWFYLSLAAGVAIACEVFSGLIRKYTRGHGGLHYARGLLTTVKAPSSFQRFVLHTHISACFVYVFGQAYILGQSDEVQASFSAPSLK